MSLNLRSEPPVAKTDLMIAAQALAVGATLVSRDRVFQRVRHLKTEDWTK
jgi:predicted nucleic acid-binding protein